VLLNSCACGSGPDPYGFDRHGYWLYGREAGTFNKMPVETHSVKSHGKKGIILGGQVGTGYPR